MDAPVMSVAAVAVLLLLGHHRWHSVTGLDIRMCINPLGLESGTIPDNSISASSSYVPNVGPQNGRLKLERAGGAWCPKQQVEEGVREFLQVELGSVHIVTGVQTQGRYDRGRGQEYAEEYQLEYWRPGLDQWRQYSRWDGKKIFTGNSDTSSVAEHHLMPPVFASAVRVLPYSVHRRTVCLRVELLGCIDNDGIISYSAPESFNLDQELTDVSYDGQRRDGRLSGGLGRLVDGQVGGDNFRLDIGYGKGNGWVAWRNDSFPQKCIELVFEFDQVRNFSAVHLFTNNFFSRDVQVFSRAKILFSIGGVHYNGRPLGYAYMPDRVMEVARDVTISLHGRVGRFVKIQLFFAAKWIMLSEVKFDSERMDLNVTDIAEEFELDCSEDEILVNPGVEITWDTLETIQAHQDGQSYVEVVVGVLTAMMLLLLVVFLIILLLSRRQKLQGTSTLLRNPFGVNVNMKDLLMNLAPPSTNCTSSHLTPVSQGAPSNPSVTSFEQYHAPLVKGKCGSTQYAALRSSADGYGTDDYMAYLSLTTTCGKLDTTSSMTPTSVTSNQIVSSTPPSPIMTPSKPRHYRSLHTTTLVGKRESRNINSLNEGNQLPSSNRKRYHTSPRDNYALPPPDVYWNIAPSKDHPYKCREAEVTPIPRYCLKILEELDTCYAGEMSICETENLSDIVPNVGRMVVIRTTKRPPTDDATGTLDSLREVRFLASLSDPNLCRVLGVVTAEQPPWTVIEYGELGDLTQYLQCRGTRNGFPRNGSKLKPLRFSRLINMATQIASGMKYLESKHVVHKDLAARNCLVSRGHVVRVGDVAMCRGRYKDDYCEIGGRPSAPVRWLPWESIMMDRYTCPGSVWQFAVTLWEVLTLCQEQPYQHLTNEQIIKNAELIYKGEELSSPLLKPTLCPVELYKLMCECWRREEIARPTFKEMFIYLNTKNMDCLALE